MSAALHESGLPLAGRQRLVIRNRPMLGLALAFCVPGTGEPLMHAIHAWATARDLSSIFGGVAWLVLALMFAGVALAMLRNRVVADHTGIHVTDFWHHHDVAWDDVDRFELPAAKRKEQVSVKLVKKDGTTVSFGTAAYYPDNFTPMRQAYAANVTLRLNELLVAMRGTAGAGGGAPGVRADEEQCAGLAT